MILGDDRERRAIARHAERVQAGLDVLADRIVGEWLLVFVAAGEGLLLAIARMKESLLRQEQIVTASDDAEISDSEQNIHGQADSLSQQIRGSERAKIIRVKQNFTQN